MHALKQGPLSIDDYRFSLTAMSTILQGELFLPLLNKKNNVSQKGGKVQ